jgi:hypothetical protein
MIAVLMCPGREHAMLRKSATAAEDELAGTYKLISTTETILETGQAVLMKHRGSIMYGRDGRVLVVIVTGDRPKPESIEKITDKERVELFRSMVAYGGTYKFDGKRPIREADIFSTSRHVSKVQISLQKSFLEVGLKFSAP